jgi:DnaJ family protein C protein 17
LKGFYNPWNSLNQPGYHSDIHHFSLSANSINSELQLQAHAVRQMMNAGGQSHDKRREFLARRQSVCIKSSDSKIQLQPASELSCCISVMDVSSEDLYAILGVDIEATDAEIKKAYRNLALVLHPDKNPDDPEAANKFGKLKAAYDALRDETKRKEYDTQFKARNERKRKLHEQDDERKRMRANLESREKQASEKYTAEKQAQQSDADAKIKLAAEIASLRKQFQTKAPATDYSAHLPPGYNPSPAPSAAYEECDASVDSSLTISVKWDKEAEPPSESLLRSLFEAYGVVDSIAVSAKQALVSFGDVGGLENALTYFGSQHNLKLSRVGKARSAAASSFTSSVPLFTAASAPSSNAPSSHSAYEQQTMARMKALIEKKKREKEEAAAAAAQSPETLNA